MKQSFQKIYSKYEELSKKYRRYLTILKILVSVLLVAYIITRVNIGDLSAIISNINAWFLVLTFLVTFIATIFFNLRYLTVLKKFDITISFGKLYLINRFSNLINFVLPGGIGQEIGRLLYIDGKNKVFISSLVDRFLGLVSIMVLLNISLLFMRIQLLYMLIIVIAGFLVIAAFFYLSRKLKQQLWDALAYSMVYTILLVIMSYFQFKALGVEIDIFTLLYYSLLINLALMLPISVQGYGIREYLWHVLLGLPLDTVLAYTLVGYFINFILSSPGLIILLRKKKIPSPQSFS
jgi:glycosyltransferase 2 family protein